MNEYRCTIETHAEHCAKEERNGYYIAAESAAEALRIMKRLHGGQTFTVDLWKPNIDDVGPENIEVTPMGMGDTLLVYCKVCLEERHIALPRKARDIINLLQKWKWEHRHPVDA